MFNVAVIIPTGVGAAIGGFAGDALPLVRALAAVCDWVVTHPNVVNGASLYYPLPNVLYTEGYALNQFAMGRWALRPGQGNPIGVIFDRAIESDLLLRHEQVMAAARATLGLDIPQAVITDTPLGVELRQGSSGATWGTIARPDSLLRAAVELLERNGRIKAIAVVARFPDEPESEILQKYRLGQGVDALAGAEAVISHLITRELELPCAHAPALRPLPLSPEVDPRACAEEIGHTFLPCVLVGLSHAPQIVSQLGHLLPGDLRSAQISAVIAPYTCCGSPALLAWWEQGSTIVLVRGNTTVLDVLPQDVGIRGIVVENYLEAIGVLVSMRAGVSPQALLR
ncbi:MAG: DUF3326 domain-containing protein [Pseudanabaenaceae cyanobacterium SKYGB_i_bin29]|nr:DUF3326 domain-containing protein [Pseudanabaenaceae cyanobacterium SKYG29]MDW8421458.1 DUF3326 domain-containing protein [Pseudanabaenaceae cyanobacterium SKYGB_i_bin29]